MERSNEASVPFVRRMEARDAEEVALLCGQLGYPRSAGDVRGWIAQPGGMGQAAFVVCVGEEVRGWIEVSIVSHLQSDRHALIGGLVIKDGARGAGLGRRLCEAAEDWSWDQGVETVRVTSRSTRREAHRFYLKDGYREVKTSMVFEKLRPGSE